MVLVDIWTCFANKFFSSSGYFWGGYWDEFEEGNYTDVNNDEPVGDFHPFYPGEPNGDRYENCQVVWSNRDYWNDFYCSQTACTFCEFERAPNLQMRGRTSMKTLRKNVCKERQVRKGYVHS